MSDQAQVTSLAAIESFRTDLILYLSKVRPVLDDVIGELSEADREAILLRFFEGRDYASVGARLRLADNTALFNDSRLIEVGPTDVIFSEQPQQQMTFDYVRGHFG